MATFSCDGVDAVIRAVEGLGEELGERAPEAVMAGARVAVLEMQKRVPVRTGGLKGSITIKGPFHTVADGYYAEISPHGTKKNGRKRERYETIGYVLEYGRSNMPARPWMRPAIEEGAEAINAAMADELSK